ncbi:hypothetical protein [Opitutus terrae]|uniref:Uncharacterized protein n=1 Tax=Opitutus terrae (strain DSM 11246 / JCM 15787 / PB90-1) TaxID=452637 RepID=B1ZPJ0_OPITP|nr:hypothetical protein [Opitutus terrae]ACB74509.1 hypothetical protein Oter_1224 [Opitutus terrae PB90-1]
MDLDRYGGASRCLLRLRENDGKPGISDQAFIGQHLARHPEWSRRPGEVDLATLFELARELELATGMDAYRDYARVLTEHAAGHSVLVATERPPQQTAAELSPQRYITLLEAMDENAFTLWCPYPSGQADVLAVARPWWDRWLCLGIVLRRG